jgi:hypothetical protein
MRSVTRRIGARMPTWPTVGRQPMRKVPAPMMSRVVTRACLRLSLSPMWPKKMPPRGRKKNATPKVAREASVAPVEPRPEKNSWGKTSAAADP